jgi:hypothetical protein
MHHPFARPTRIAGVAGVAATLARSGLAVAASAGLCAAAVAASPAGLACPDYFFLSGNTALNVDFETPAPGTDSGSLVCWTANEPVPPPSAADQWLMHSSNNGAKVCSKLVPSTAPGHAPGGKMMVFQAGGNEGGIYQATGALPGHAYMFSAWVKVLKGQVAVQPNGGASGPVSWTSKVGEWEQLRACTNSTADASAMFIVNEDPAGGLFFIDRIEFRELPLRE